MTQTQTAREQLMSVEEAVDFLGAQGFQVNLVDGVYRVRKEGWGKRPYELDAETLIKQANMIRGAAKTTESRPQPKESELDRAERRLMEACHKLDAQLRATMAEVRTATEVVRQLQRGIDKVG